MTRATAELKNAAPFRDEEFEVAQVFRMKKKPLFSTKMRAEEPSRHATGGFHPSDFDIAKLVPRTSFARFERQPGLSGTSTWATSRLGVRKSCAGKAD